MLHNQCQASIIWLLEILQLKIQAIFDTAPVLRTELLFMRMAKTSLAAHELGEGFPVLFVHGHKIKSGGVGDDVAKGIHLSGAFVLREGSGVFSNFSGLDYV